MPFNQERLKELKAQSSLTDKQRSELDSLVLLQIKKAYLEEFKDVILTDQQIEVLSNFRSLQDLQYGEMCAINYYTGSDFKKINNFLRNNGLTTDPVNIATILLHTAIASHGLTHLPDIHLPSYTLKRAQGAGLLQELQNKAAFGQIYQEKSFLSTSEEHGIFKSKSIHILYQNILGKYIAPISLHPKEEEFLIPPSAQIKIKKYIHLKDGGNLFIAQGANVQLDRSELNSLTMEKLKTMDLETPLAILEYAKQLFKLKDIPKLHQIVLTSLSAALANPEKLLEKLDTSNQEVFINLLFDLKDIPGLQQDINRALVVALGNPEKLLEKLDGSNPKVFIMQLFKLKDIPEFHQTINKALANPEKLLKKLDGSNPKVFIEELFKLQDSPYPSIQGAFVKALTNTVFFEKIDRFNQEVYIEELFKLKNSSYLKIREIFTEVVTNPVLLKNIDESNQEVFITKLFRHC